MQPTKKKEVDFILQRKFLTDNYTIGSLSISDFIICATLEDKVRNLDAGEVKVLGETAIPYGRYKMTVSYSPKFKRKLPDILDVPHFTSIRIHAGNKPGHTEGCILPGENTIKGQVTNSRYWEQTITMLIEAYHKAGFDVYINII